MSVKVANNAYSTLASGISDVATTLSVQAGHGARFPVTSVDDYFYVTLIDTSNNLEIVKVTTRSTDTFTIVRAQDGTTARAYIAGDRVELRFTKAVFEALPTRQMATADLEDEAVTYAKVAAASIADDAAYWAATASRLLDTSVWDAGAIVTLTDAATIAVDMGTFLNATVTLAGNRTLGAPSNAKVGQSGFIRVIQDGTGSRTLAYNSAYKFAGGSAPVLSTAAGSVDVLFYTVVTSTFVLLTLSKGWA